MALRYFGKAYIYRKQRTVLEFSFNIKNYKTSKWNVIKQASGELCNFS